MILDAKKPNGPFLDLTPEGLNQIVGPHEAKSTSRFPSSHITQALWFSF